MFSTHQMGTILSERSDSLAMTMEGTMKQEMKTEHDFPKTSAPAERALVQAGYSRLKELTKVTETEVARLHGMGPRALRILREALEAKGLSFAQAGKRRAAKEARASSVAAFMKELDHPLKVEVEIVRGIIKGVNKDITEEIKWKAPSFSYKGEYLVTFNLRDMKRIHLVFHNPMIPRVKSHLLEGDYVDRRMTYFANMKDIRANKAELERILKQLIKLNAK
jgi:uncharacterized protein YdhG (YjbR/CyaY superfamily)